MSIPLLWQTLLLMTIAYLMGAALACFVRRSFFAAHAPATRAVAPAPLRPPPAPSTPRPAAPAAAPHSVSVPVAMPGAVRGGVSAPMAPISPASAATAFRRADNDTPTPTSPPPAPVAPQPEGARAAMVPPSTLPSSAGEGNNRFGQALSGPGEAAITSAATRPAFDTAAAAAAASAAAAAAGLLRREKGDAASASPPAPPTRPVVVVPAGSRPMPSDPGASADDLKRIRAIDERLEAQLNELGVSRFDQIAAWHAQDVARFSQVLGFRGRIEHENWIEQAQILARGGETFYSRRRDRGPTATVGVAATSASPISLRPDTGQSLDNATADAARKASELSTLLVRTEDLDADPAHAAPSSQPDAPSPPGSSAALAAAAAAAAAAASAAIVPATPMAPRVATTPPAAGPLARTNHDQLQRIAGINAEIERLLNVQGIRRFNQIANWSRADIDRFDRLLGHPGRIARENWIEQAQILSKGSDTAFSREFERRQTDEPTAPPATTAPAHIAEATQSQARPAGDSARAPRPGDLSSLRSVRSEAYRSEPASPGETAVAGSAGAAAASAETGKLVRSSIPDDLKRIRGVGVLIEKKLNSMGIVRYEQIANWTTGDIERVSRALDFKGRIERENWVEQARILGSGGHTDFSRRVDRGDVETSRGRP